LANNLGSKGYFLAGLGLGTVVSVLLASQSGRQTRRRLAQAGFRGKEFVRTQSRRLRDRAAWLLRRARRAASKGESIAAVLEEGRDEYQQEKIEAQ
jgi:hypothetical protein